MAWKAISSAVTMDLQVWRIDTAARKPFVKAQEMIFEKYKYADPDLSTGAVSDIAICKALSAAVNIDCCTNLTWTVTEVKENYINADWQKSGKDNAWAIETAQRFMRTCIDLELGISFFKN